MTSNDKRLRRELIRQLNENGSRFDYAAFVKTADVEPRLVDIVAEAVFRQFYSQTVEHNKITEREQRQLDVLAKRLALAEPHRALIEQEMGTTAYQQRMREAQADGVLTSEELEELRQLQEELGLVESGEHDSLDREAKIARVRASRQYAERNSRDRIERLPETEAGGWWLRGCFLSVITFIGLFLLTIGVLAAIVSAKGKGDATLMIIMIATFVCGGFVTAVAVAYWRISYRHFRKAERTSLSVTPAIVVDKRKVVRRETFSSEGREGNISDDRGGVNVMVDRFATFEDEQGNRREYSLFEPNWSATYGVSSSRIDRVPEPRSEFYSKLEAGDAGVLFARDDYAFDFDRVC